MSAKYAVMVRHREAFTIALMCRVLDVAPSGFYAAQRWPPSARAARDEQLRVQIRTVHRQSRRRYGAPRIHQELRDQGERVAKKRVARLMREDGLRGRRPRRFVATTDSVHAAPIAPNTLDRRFGIATIPAPDHVWAADITYLPTRAGWLYLAVVLDLFSRRVVGWALRPTLERALAVAALRQALHGRRPAPGGLHHSDRGSQYASGDYRALLAAHGLDVSMSRRGDCWDNAVVESFFATLKVELVHDANWETRDQAARDIFEFIEIWYNRQRRHSSLGYRTPVQYEDQHENALHDVRRVA